MTEEIQQLTLPLAPAGNVAQTPMRDVIKNKFRNGHFVCHGPCGREVSIGVIIKGLVYCRKCAESLKGGNL